MNPSVTTLVFLPATDPADDRFGRSPHKIQAYPGLRVHTVWFPEMVWYNASIRAETLRQIGDLKAGAILLVGFSKSGLGAWNLGLELPGSVAGTVIFDAPVSEPVLPPWGTFPFYQSNDCWLKDLPINRMGEFVRIMPSSHRLILASGEFFHGQMQRLSLSLNELGVGHTWLPEPQRKHHWNSGWLENCLKAAFALPRPPMCGA